MWWYRWVRDLQSSGFLTSFGWVSHTDCLAEAFINRPSDINKSPLLLISEASEKLFCVVFKAFNSILELEVKGKGTLRFGGILGGLVDGLGPSFCMGNLKDLHTDCLDLDAQNLCNFMHISLCCHVHSCLSDCRSCLFQHQCQQLEQALECLFSPHHKAEGLVSARKAEGLVSALRALGRVGWVWWYRWFCVHD